MSIPAKKEADEVELPLSRRQTDETNPTKTIERGNIEKRAGRDTVKEAEKTRRQESRNIIARARLKKKEHTTKER